MRKGGTGVGPGGRASQVGPVDLQVAPLQPGSTPGAATSGISRAFAPADATTARDPPAESIWDGRSRPVIRSRRVFAIAGVVAVAILVATAFWSMRAVPAPSPPPAVSRTLSFSGAAVEASEASASWSGGPWAIWGGLGVASASSPAKEPYSMGNLLDGVLAGCAASNVLQDSTFTLNATPATPDSGLSAAWLVVPIGAPSNLLEVTALPGAVEVDAQMDNSSTCPGGLSLTLSSTEGYLCSSAAASEAMDLGGAAFVDEYTAYAEDLQPVGGLEVTDQSHSLIQGPMWVANLTTCGGSVGGSATFANEAPDAFTAMIDAVRGTVINTANDTEPCGSDPDS
jgi:hypothetical protein